MVPMTVVMKGPKAMAGRPVPVGWDELPVTEGSFREERMKTKPPVIPRRGRASRSRERNLRSYRIPRARQGRAASHQRRHHEAGRNPSMICTGTPPNFTCFNYIELVIRESGR